VRGDRVLDAALWSLPGLVGGHYELICTARGRYYLAQRGERLSADLPARRLAAWVTGYAAKRG
jgi:hypothetical protein